MRSLPDDGMAVAESGREFVQLTTRTPRKDDHVSNVIGAWAIVAVGWVLLVAVTLASGDTGSAIGFAVLGVVVVGGGLFSVRLKRHGRGKRKG